MQIEILRIKRLVADVKHLIDKERFPVTSFEIIDGKNKEGQWRSYTVGENWKSYDQHRWFKTQVNVPKISDHERVIFRLITGREGQWDACNPQFLFYVNGTLVQGCDVNHREVILTDIGQTVEVAFLAYGGTQGDDLIVRAEVCVVDLETEALYYDMKNPCDALELVFDQSAQDKTKLLKGLDEAADLLDLRMPYSESYYTALDAARVVLQRHFYSEMATCPVVYAVGNTHIDIAWLWTVEQTKEKVLRSYSTVLELMNRFPDYKFLGSQAVLYHFVKTQDPEMFEAIKARVKEGRWEVDGAMWVEADCNIPSGESLVRQILKGEHFFETEFGVRSKTLWLPDVFGYSAALPQILKQFDIPYFLTTKIAWNQYNQLPNDMFLWRGLDGSEVFAFMPTTCDANKYLGNNISFTDTRNTTTYTGIIGANMTLGTYNRFQNKSVIEDTLMLYGYGDGGGGPTAEMLENAERLKFGLPGIPRLMLSTNAAYLKKAHEAIRKAPKPPTWQGELYFEYHRGTLTSNGAVKKWNRYFENQLKQLEGLHAQLIFEGSSSIQKADIDAIWDTVLLNQFHDIIPGTSIAAVYDQTAKEYAQANRSLTSLMNTAMSVWVNASSDTATVYNPHVQINSDYVWLTTESPIDHLIGADGVVAVQKNADGFYGFFASDVPPLQFRTYKVVYGNSKETKKDAMPLETFSYENAFYTVVFNASGEITSLKEKTTGFDLVGEGVLNRIRTFEDRPANWDNWDVDIFYQRKAYELDLQTPLHVVAQGSEFTQLEATLTTGLSKLTQRITLYKDSPRIEVAHDVDWQENHLLLRTECHTAIRQNKATFDVQYGAVERETTNNHSWDLAKFETCAHKWIDYSDFGVGLSLLTDAKYGYSVKEGVMGVSLIKSGAYPNDSADKGHHAYRYALYPHKGTWQNSDVLMQADNFNLPMTATCGEVTTPYEPLIRALEGHATVEALKVSEEGSHIILRLRETKNGYGTVNIKLHEAITEMAMMNLREEVLTTHEVEAGRISLTFKPFELKTIGIPLRKKV